MSETRGRSGQEGTRLGGFILAVVALVTGSLVIAAPFYYAGHGARTQFMLASAQCEPNLSPSGLNCVDRFMLNRQYNRLVNPVIEQVNADMAAYSTSEYRNRTAAEVALRAETTTANGLASSLAQFHFSPMSAPVARKLIRDIHAQTKLTAQQALSSSLRHMRSFNGQVKAAGAAVRAEFRLLAKAVDQRVTPSEEPP